MALIRNDDLSEDDFRTLADDEALPGKGGVIVSLARWQKDRDALLGRKGPLGVRLKSDESPEAIADDLGRLALVALEFPKFRDGRAFTLARELRERHGYDREIRATGHIIPDQYLFLVRAGVNTVEVPSDRDIAAWRLALEQFTVAYQPGVVGDTPLSLLRRRLSLGGAA